MKKMIVLMFVGLVFVANAPTKAAEGTGPVEKFVTKQFDQLETGCKAELETYCKAVTPGAGRQAACIYAHSDKLSSSCERALYNSAQEFEVAGVMMNAFVAACQADVEKLCSKVAIGEGRILKCLEENKEKVSAPCTAARQEAKAGLEPKQSIA